jgi:DNA-binding NarL/FixJ family response regulator
MTYKILIADDSAVIRRVLRASIEQKTDWEVYEVKDGSAAVRGVAELDPDLVVLDLQMPGMNGLEAARQITRLDPDLPMLMFTMYSSDQLVKEAHAAGIAEVFSKSTGLAEHLISAMQNILDPLGRPVA